MLQSYNVFGVGRWSRHFSFLPITDPQVQQLRIDRCMCLLIYLFRKIGTFIFEVMRELHMPSQRKCNHGSVCVTSGEKPQRISCPFSVRQGTLSPQLPRAVSSPSAEIDKSERIVSFSTRLGWGWGKSLTGDQDDVPLQIVLGGRLEQKRFQSPRFDGAEPRMNPQSTEENTPARRFD